MVKTLLTVVELFKKNRIDYCLIGGLAMMLHHGRANTVDMDFYVMVENLDDVLKLFHKKGYQADPAGDYQLKCRVEDVPIDILCADHYIGVDVVRRAVERSLGDSFVRIATPEDLIILKTMADRSVDRRDVEELRELFGKKLDEAYIKKKLEFLKKLLAPA